MQKFLCKKFNETKWVFTLLLIAVLMMSVPVVAVEDAPEGFEVLFNGEDFSNWVVPEGDGGHWKVIDGVIDYDAQSQAPGDKNLWTEESFGDFIMHIDWRLKETPYINPGVPIIKRDGTNKLDENGNTISFPLPDSDSGLFLRGEPKAQVNIWTWPVGSGEVWGFRTDPSLTPEQRAAVTPITNADNNIGDWNTFVITMKGDRLTVYLNDYLVIDNAELPGVSEEGPIALQHHGGKRDGEWAGSPSLVQFRNIFIKRLNDE